jgi:MFS family permease
MSSNAGHPRRAVEPVDRRRWFGLIIISLGVALIIVDSTIVNVAVPSIIEDLGISSTQAQWVQEVYTLVFAALLLVWGRLADRWGRRRLFAIGVLVFAAASVLAAAAGSGTALIAARALQGIGGSMMLPTSLSLLNATFRGRERGIAFGIWGATIGGTAALGPLLGGWLTTSYSWRWAFGINVPLGIIVAIGTFLLVQESTERNHQPGVDVWGAVLSMLGFGAVVFGLIEGRTYGWLTTTDTTFAVGDWSWPWGVSPVAFAFGLGVVALSAFGFLQRARNAAGKVAMLDLRLFSIPSFRNGNLAAAIVSLGEFGLLFALPLWFQNVLGYSAFQTGLALLALATGSFVASGLGAALIRRRSPIFVVRLGITLEFLGVAGIALVLRPDTTWTVVTPLLFVYGIGVGFATAQLTGVVLADVPIERSGQGSGTQSTARQIGSAFGIAILGTVLFSTLGTQLDSSLSRAGVPEQARASLVLAVKDSAGAIIPSLDKNPQTAPYADDARQAFTDATRLSAATAAGFLILGLAASLSLGSRRNDGSEEASDTRIDRAASTETTPN